MTNGKKAEMEAEAVMEGLVRGLFKRFGFELVRAQVGEKKGSLLNDASFRIEYAELELGGDKYFVPKYALHRPAVRKLLDGMLYEPDTHKFVEEFCARFSGSIFTAGTFFGDMLPNFSKFVSGNVYAFEPVLENYILAKLTVEHNRLHNVILTNSALGAAIENLKINSIDERGRHAGGSSKIDELGEICTSITIDTLNADDVVLIQLDVEGHELAALTGAIDTIQRCRPVIAIEDNNANCENFLIEREYDLVRKIPGLNIWVPAEKIEVKEMVSGIEFKSPNVA